MKRIPSLIVVSALIVALGFMLQSFAKHSMDKDNGKKVTPDQVGEFKVLSVEGSMQVIVTPGAVSAARLEGDEKELADIEFTKKGDELIVGEKENSGDHKDVKVYLSSPSIEKFNLSGSGSVTGTAQFKTGSSMSLDLAGSGDITLDLNAEKLSGEVAGSGEINISGFAKHTSFEIAGSGDIKGEDFTTDEAKVEISGSGDAIFNANNTLSADIAGSGDVYYGGQPHIDADIAGTGQVRPKKI